MTDGAYISLVLGAAHIGLAVGVSCHILLTKDEVRAAVAWIGLVLLSPFLGSFVYFLLGINRINRKALELRGTNHGGGGGETVGRPIPDFGRAMLGQMRLLSYAVHNAPIMGSNDVVPLVNGDAAFPEMLAAIDGATESVALSSYIFDRDESGLLFVAALVRAHERGVAVRVLLDDVGLRYSKKPVDEDLKAAGVMTARFMPSRTPSYFRFMNLRSHRKMMQVDGELGFIGGMNIRHGNVLKAKPAHPVQDVHFKVRGPVLNQINEIFEEDWLFSCKEVVDLPRWKERNIMKEGVLARVVPDGPDDDLEKLYQLFLGAISCAHERIRIVTPYFLPNLVLVNALQVAAMRGVVVEVVVPQKSNIPFFDWAMQANYAALLENGVEIWQNPAPFDHSKIFIVDNIWCSIGSSNWDMRSFRLNFEVNLECVDQQLCEELNRIVDAKRARAKAVALDDVRAYSVVRRLRNNCMRLFSPYL